MTHTMYHLGCNNARHDLRVESDGRIVITHPKCIADSERVALVGAAARIGVKPPDMYGCLGLVLLVQHGLPAIFDSGGVGQELNLGLWRDLYIRYESHSLVQKTCNEMRRAAHAPYAETFAAARTALAKLRKQYRFEGSRNELHTLTSFVPQCTPEQLLGQPVATFSGGHWLVPLQREWLESVHKAQLSMLDEHFVVGVSETTPGVVYALAEEGSGRVVVREFFYNHKNGKLGAIKPENV